MLTNLITVAGVATVEIPTPTPDPSGPGIHALLMILGWIFMIVLILCVLGGLLSGAAIGAGKFFNNGQVQSLGFGGLIGCIIGVAVCGVIVVVLNFVFHAFGG